MNEKSKVGTAATLAAAAALVALACTCSTCGLSDFSLPSLGGGGGSDADAEAFYDALLEHEYEDPFDPELLVMADDDGDGLPEATYPLTVEEEVAPGVYLDRWLYVDPNGEEIDGTLQLVLENTTDEAVDVTFVDEIPKTVREHIEPGDIQVEPPVEITILDPDPRYEVRVFQFAAGLRQTIAETKTDVNMDEVKSLADALDIDLLDVVPKETVDQTISEKLGGVIEMTARSTARDYEFLRRAKRCVEYTQPGVELTEKQQKEAWACNMRLVAEFRENFTADVCSEAGLYRIRPNQGSDSGIPAGWRQSCEQFFAQSCTEHENDGVRAMCLEAMRRESYIECTLWPAAEQEHCRLVADRSHTENCSMMIADRASRRVCCDKMTGDLKDLCLEDNTAVQVAEEGSEAAGAQQARPVDEWFSKPDCQRFAEMTPGGELIWEPSGGAGLKCGYSWDLVEECRGWRENLTDPRCGEDNPPPECNPCRAEKLEVNIGAAPSDEAEQKRWQGFWEGTCIDENGQQNYVGYFPTGYCDEARNRVREERAQNDARYTGSELQLTTTHANCHIRVSAIQADHPTPHITDLESYVETALGKAIALCDEKRGEQPETTGLDFFTQENAERVCPTLHGSLKTAYGSYEPGGQSQSPVVLCIYDKDPAGELELRLEGYSVTERAQEQWDGLMQGCQEGVYQDWRLDVTDCGQDEIFWSKDPIRTDSSCGEGYMDRTNRLYRRPLPGMIIAISEDCVPETDINRDNMLPLMDAAETLVGETLTLGEVLGTK